MSARGLTKLEIENIINFNWDESADESEDDDIEKDEFLENVIEERMQSLKEQELEVDLNKKIVQDENEDDIDMREENPDVLQETLEKVDLTKLRWRSNIISAFDTTWKSKVSCYETKEPQEYFNHFFDEEIVQNICTETNKYAMQKDGFELKCEVYEIKRFIGVLLYLGVVNLPHMKMAWSENYKLEAVAKAFSRNRFEKIKQYFHINDNNAQAEKGHENYDKPHKVRPLLAKLKDKFNQISQDEYQSVDEQIIAYKGHNSMKQYLPKKPHKWGFKMFTRAGVSGIIYDFAMYVGDGTCPSYGLGISSDIVVYLSKNIPQHQNYKLFFDNWFTSISLLVALKERGILAVGTLRANRIKNCDLKSEKQLQQNGRGSSDIKFESEYNLIVCRWFDNKIVQLASNYIGESPVSACNRWCQKNKTYVTIPRPAIVECYNKHMGGVDLADMLLELYKINHRSNKWYTRIVYWCINTSVVNSWLLYRRDLKFTSGEKKHVSLLNFQLSIANELMNATNEKYVPRKRGRPSSLQIDIPNDSPSSSGQPSPALSSPGVSSPATPPLSRKRNYIAEPVKNIRYDKTNHWVQWGSKGRCRMC